MININSLKAIIRKDEENIIKILSRIDCHSITTRVLPKGTEIRFALPNHNNPTSGVVFADNLFCTTYTPGLEFSGDLISFVKFLKKVEYQDAITICCYALNISFNDLADVAPVIFTEESILFGRDIISCHKNAKMGAFNVDDIDVPSIDMDQCSQYIFCPHMDLIQEGIGSAVQEKFSIGYDLWTKRILFPHRFWNSKSGDFVGVFGRTTNPYWETLGIPKYWGLKGYPKRTNLYGLWENLKERKPKNLNDKQKLLYRTIRDNHYIVIYEAEKSVLKRATWNDFTGVALMGHQLQPEQINIINQLDDVHEVIFALDKDVPEEYVKSMCKKIITKKVSYIIDKDGLLGEKDSPADASQKVFWQLMQKRIKV